MTLNSLPSIWLKEVFLIHNFFHKAHLLHTSTFLHLKMLDSILAIHLTSIFSLFNLFYMLGKGSNIEPSLQLLKHIWDSEITNQQRTPKIHKENELSICPHLDILFWFENWDKKAKCHFAQPQLLICMHIWRLLFCCFAHVHEGLWKCSEWWFWSSIYTSVGRWIHKYRILGYWRLTGCWALY